MNRLNGSSPQGSAVVGARRIGKSSLLHYLVQPRPDEHVRPNGGMRLVYLDAAQGSCSTPGQFQATLLRAALAAQKIDRRTAEGRWLAELQQNLAGPRAECSWTESRAALEKLPAHPVVCLDEFEALLTHAFDDRFFNGLRSWANEGLLTWVTASARPLESLGQLHGHSSPFFNLLGTVSLAGLAAPEVDILLDLAQETPSPFSPSERKLIRRLAGRHPYHLQIAAWKLWELKQSGTVSPKEVRRYLCRQPNPPPNCAPRRWSPSSPQLAWGLVVILAGALAALLWGLIPAVRQGAAFAFEQASPIWSWLGQFGDSMGGLILLLIILIVVIGGLLKRKRLTEIIRDLWGRIT